MKTWVFDGVPEGMHAYVKGRELRTNDVFEIDENILDKATAKRLDGYVKMKWAKPDKKKEKK